MKIVALDIGANMALAHNGFIDFIVTDHTTFDGPRASRLAAAMHWLNKRLGEIVKDCGPMDLLIYERPFSRGFDATRSGWGYAGVIEALATSHGMAVADQTPQSIKSFALAKVGKTAARGKKKLTKAERTEKGAAEKLAMIAAAQEMGYYGEHEHEADAFCLLRYTETYAVKGNTNAQPSKRRRTDSVPEKGAERGKRKRSGASDGQKRKPGARDGARSQRAKPDSRQRKPRSGRRAKG